VDARMQQQVERCVGKKLGRSGYRAIGKPEAIEHHPGHGCARRDLLVAIGHQAGIEPVNAEATWFSLFVHLLNVGIYI
jgi:hypothetical protein